MIKCGFQNQVEEQAEGIAEINTRKGRCARNRTCEKTNDRAKHESAVVRRAARSIDRKRYECSAVPKEASRRVL